MATRARRKITLTFSGEIDGENEYNAAENVESPVYVQTYTMVAGNHHQFIVPSALNAGLGGAGDAVCVTILKPSDYTGTIILKGATTASDAEGVYLHPTDPDCITIDPSVQEAIVLKPSAECIIRLVWS